MASEAAWPFSSYPRAYQMGAAPVLIGCLFLWSLGQNFTRFLEPSPLPYIPLLNPIDLAQMIALFVMFEWYKRYGETFGIDIVRDECES